MRLYWVDAFFDKIEHSNFDGQNRLSLDRITQISHPFGLTIFEGNKSWYKQLPCKVQEWVNFTDIHLNCSLSFMSKEQLLLPASDKRWWMGSYTLLLLPYEGYAYFTDWRLGGIVRVRKTDGGEMVIIRRGISHIMHVKSFNSNSQIGQ